MIGISFGILLIRHDIRPLDSSFMVRFSTVLLASTNTQGLLVLLFTCFHSYIPFL
jgi:hypothetical protein